MGATASSLVCVSESTPVYFAFLPFAVLPRRFTVPWFVHAWCLLPATTAALTIRARQVMSELRATTQFWFRSRSVSASKMAYALQQVCRCVTSTVLRLLPQHRSMGGKCATCDARPNRYAIRASGWTVSVSGQIPKRSTRMLLWHTG